MVWGISSIILFGSCKESPKPVEPIVLFDGVSFTNWDGDTSYWRIADSTLIGEVTPANPLKENTFLIYNGPIPENFELELEYRISADGNSGVQYRSQPVPALPYALKGYQADIDGANVYTGQNYEERGRGFLAMRGQSVELRSGQAPIILDTIGNADELKKQIKSADWNRLKLSVDEFHLIHFINGIKMSETMDLDSSLRQPTGLLGLQLHVAPQMRVEFRNIILKSLNDQ